MEIRGGGEAATKKYSIGGEDFGRRVEIRHAMVVFLHRHQFLKKLDCLMKFSLLIMKMLIGPLD